MRETVKEIQRSSSPHGRGKEMSPTPTMKPNGLNSETIEMNIIKKNPNLQTAE